MPRTRGNGEGMIRKRTDDTWEARYTDRNGKQKSLYAKTRQAAARRLTAALRDRDKGIPTLQDERQTVGQYLTHWLDTMRSQIRPSTHRRYSDFARVHIIPAIGKIRLTALTALTAQHVQSLYSKKLKEGLSPTTVHHIHAALHQALKDAVKLGLLQRNVTELVSAPRRDSQEMLVLTEDEARHFLSCAQGDRFQALYALVLTTGMRLGELLGLRWQDIDFERATLQVRMGVVEDGPRFVLGEVKTAYSRRTIGLTLLALDALRQHRAEQEEKKRLLGGAWDGAHNLVFPNAVGGIMIPDNLTKRSFKTILETAGLSSAIRFHDLRHTAATILLSHGVNVKVVSEMLGHADISITLRVYAHVTAHMQQAAVDVMTQVFPPVVVGVVVLDVKEEPQEA